MAEVEFDQSIVDQAMGQLDYDAASRNPRWAGDSLLYVRFFYHPHRDEEASAAAGRPIYRDREYIEIMVPGNRDNVINRPVDNTDRVRFARQYARFKENQHTQQVGTTLEAWPAISRSEVEELKHFSIFTVEQLAAISDNICAKLPHLYNLRTRAKDFLEAAQGAAQIDQLRSEIEKRDSQIEALSRQITELTAAVSSLADNRASEEPVAKTQPRKPPKPAPIEEALDPEDR